jgi:phosphoribosylformylglycinamidine synthase
MAFAGGLGAVARLKDVPLGENIKRDDYILFSESNSRFLAEIAPQDKDKFEETMSEAAFACIGEVAADKSLEIFGLKGKSILLIPVDELKAAWQKPLGV